MTVKKSKNVPVKVLNDILAEVNNVVEVEIPGGHGAVMEVKRNIPLKDALQFVSDIVGSCLDAEAYNPEAFEIAVCVGVLTYYTNLTLPQSIEKQYEIVYNLGVYDLVMEHVNGHQVDDIRKAAKEKLDHQVAVISSGVLKRVTDMSDEIDKFLSTVSAMTDGIDGGVLNSFIKKVAESDNVDELTLAKAVMESQKQEPPAAQPQRGNNLTVLEKK